MAELVEDSELSLGLNSVYELRVESGRIVAPNETLDVLSRRGDPDLEVSTIDIITTNGEPIPEGVVHIGWISNWSTSAQQESHFMNISGQ